MNQTPIGPDRRRRQPKASSCTRKRDRIAYVTINRPEARNAVSPEVHRAMIAAWADFAEDASVERLGRFYEKRTPAGPVPHETGL